MFLLFSAQLSLEQGSLCDSGSTFCLVNFACNQEVSTCIVRVSIHAPQVLLLVGTYVLIIQFFKETLNSCYMERDLGEKDK